VAARAVARSATLTVRGREVPYTLYRVPRRKHVHLMIGDDGDLVVRAPWRFSLKSAEETIRENLPWAVDALERAQERRSRRQPLVSGAELPLFDERLRLELRMCAQLSLLADSSAGNKPSARSFCAVSTRDGWAWRQGRSLRVCAYSLSPRAPRNLLESWYRREARRRLPPRLQRFAEVLDVAPRRVAVRGQRTRWGSCSSHGTISLNWRLLLLPSELSDYILVHELCHLRHLDHSKRFWRLVGTVLPDYAERERRLEAAQDTLAF